MSTDISASLVLFFKWLLSSKCCPEELSSCKDKHRFKCKTDRVKFPYFHICHSQTWISACFVDLWMHVWTSVSVNEGQVNFQFRVSPEMSPEFQVVAYAVLPSEDVISHSADFSSYKCFSNKVSIILEVCCVLGVICLQSNSNQSHPQLAKSCENL